MGGLYRLDRGGTPPLPAAVAAYLATLSGPEQAGTRRAYHSTLHALIETVRIRGRSTARVPPVVSEALCGEVDLGLGRAAMMGEAWVPAVEAAGQVVVEDSGADLEEELGSGR